MRGRLSMLLLALIGGCGETTEGTAEAPPPETRALFGDLRLPGAELDAGAQRHRGLDFAAVTAPPAESFPAAWRNLGATADRHNTPGRFTALLAMDVAPESPADAVRTLLFRDPELPEAPSEGPPQADLTTLWAWMDALRDRGVAALAVVSPTTPGTALGAAAPAHGRRGRNEPLAAIARPEDQAPIDAALGLGIVLESTQGSNPFQFGLVAAGSSGTAGPSGLTGVWAADNTREDVYAALRRRETFATRGARIALRLSAGFDRTGSDAAGAVFMGGDLLPTAGEPTFRASAVADPGAPPLRRLQIVKGWAAGGIAHQHVFDVACAGAHERTDCPPAAGSPPCAPDDATARRQLVATWQDPQFAADQEAYYYLRVLAGGACEATPEAWSSPIWYHGSVTSGVIR